MTHTELEVPGYVGAHGRTPAVPAPGEPPGPPLSDFVVQLQRTAEGLERLYRQATYEAMYRVQRGVASGATDNNGDAVLEIFQVPQGATGYLMLAALDEAGVTPAAPDTSGTLWHAIFGSNGRTNNPVAVGNLFDFLLDAATAGDAKIPAVYKYPDKVGAPSLVGPGVFYLVIDAATAAQQVAVRWAVLVEQPEP